MYGLFAMLVFAADVAQADPSAISPLTGVLVGSTGGIGFAAWIARHLITVVLPQMQAEHAAERVKQDDLHAAALAKVTGDFMVELREMRANHRDDMKILWTEVRSNSNMMATALNNLTNGLRHVDNTIKRGDSGVLKGRGEGENQS